MQVKLALKAKHVSLDVESLLNAFEAQLKSKISFSCSAAFDHLFRLFNKETGWYEMSI